MWTGFLKRSVNPKEGIKGDGVLTFFFFKCFQNHWLPFIVDLTVNSHSLYKGSLIPT